MPVGFACLDRARHVDRLTHQQQAFGDGGFTGIRVRDDGKGTAFGDFGGGDAHGKPCSLTGVADSAAHYTPLSAVTCVSRVRS